MEKKSFRGKKAVKLLNFLKSGENVVKSDEIMHDDISIDEVNVVNVYNNENTDDELTYEFGVEKAQPSTSDFSEENVILNVRDFETLENALKHVEFEY